MDNLEAVKGLPLTTAMCQLTNQVSCEISRDIAFWWWCNLAPSARGVDVLKPVLVYIHSS